VSFWIVPGIAVTSSQVATMLGDPSAGIWYTSLYTMCNAIAFMICGANSDLFGRRWFLIMGNVLLFVGHIMGGVAKNNTTMIAAFAIIGFGAGNAQLAAFALPELLPNKWRHISVTIADLGMLDYTTSVRRLLTWHRYLDSCCYWPYCRPLRYSTR
jgi:MFS family permease